MLNLKDINKKMDREKAIDCIEGGIILLEKTDDGRMYVRTLEGTKEDLRLEEYNSFNISDAVLTGGDDYELDTLLSETKMYSSQSDDGEDATKDLDTLYEATIKTMIDRNSGYKGFYKAIYEFAKSDLIDELYYY